MVRDGGGVVVAVGGRQAVGGTPEVREEVTCQRRKGEGRSQLPSRKKDGGKKKEGW
jgi:hypothetical protein